MNDDPLRVATRLFDAIERGDLAQVADCYSDDVIVWHNHDDISQSRAENLAQLRRAVDRTVERRYLRRRTQSLPDGFVQQHVLHMRRHDGRALQLRACMIVKVADGKVVRIDEYLDASPLAAWYAE